MNDKLAFERHASAMERCFQPTQNPALISLCERLATKALSKGLRQRDLQSPRPLPSPTLLSGEVQMLLSAMRTAVDPSMQALELLMQVSKARSGYLYLLRGGDFFLAGARGGKAPPAELEAKLRAMTLEAASRQMESETELITDDVGVERTANDTMAPIEEDAGDYHLAVLRHGPVVLGGVMFDAANTQIWRETELLQSLLSALHDRLDVY